MAGTCTAPWRTAEPPETPVAVLQIILEHRDATRMRRYTLLLVALDCVRGLSPFRAWCATARVAAPQCEHAEFGGVPGVRVTGALAAGDAAIIVPGDVALVRRARASRVRVARAAKRPL